MKVSDNLKSYLELRKEWQKPLPAKLCQDITRTMEDLWWEFSTEEIQTLGELLEP